MTGLSKKLRATFVSRLSDSSDINRLLPVPNNRLPIEHSRASKLMLGMLLMIDFAMALHPTKCDNSLCLHIPA